MTLTTGAGAPVTVVAHGFGTSLPESRALASGIVGTKVFPQARGHGTAPDPERAGYAELANDILRVADEHSARQAFGTSMGAHSLLRLISHHPHRFDRLVLFLPAAIDTPVQRNPALTEALRRGDRAAVLSAVQQELLPLCGLAVDTYAAARTDFLLASPGVLALLAGLPDDVPVVDRAELAAVTAKVLVVGQEGDAVHPSSVARELAGLLTGSELMIFERPGVAFRERAALRTLISDFLRPF